MGAVEDAVDAAAEYVGPFVDAAADPRNSDSLAAADVVTQALHHLLAINTADLAADPNAPYDASLAGVVYSLLDLITSLGVLPHLAPGAVFSQRPRSVLAGTVPALPSPSEALLANVVQAVIPVLFQPGSGVQPLLSQRILPDIVCALATLSFSPDTTQETRSEFKPVFHQVLSSTATSRLLPIFTTLLQQSLPAWLKPVAARELTLIPLRPQGIRHVIEFLSLSALSNNTEVPQQAESSPSKTPMPLEAISQAARLLVLPPVETSQDEWIRSLEPQLLALLDGGEGRELSRASGHIIAAGILNKKATGAPGTVGWQLFAQPLLETIRPTDSLSPTERIGTDHKVLVQDTQLLVSLQRLNSIVLAHSHAGLIKRLVGPLLLPLWATLNHAKAKRILDKQWTDVPTSVLTRYLSLVSAPEHMDLLTTNLFWDGTDAWTHGAGSRGGIEIRSRSKPGVDSMDSILSRIGGLDDRVRLFVSLLSSAQMSDDAAGGIFVRVTKRWLAPNDDSNTKTLLTDEPDLDPLAALVDAKLSEALAKEFQDSFARCPQHVVELMCLILRNYIAEHKGKEGRMSKVKGPSRASLGAIVGDESAVQKGGSDTSTEDLVSFAMSILHTIFSSSDYQSSSLPPTALPNLVPILEYLSQPHRQLPITPIVSNSATNLLGLLGPAENPRSTASHTRDVLAEHREALKEILPELTSPEPPNRTWALNGLGKLIQSKEAFPVIDLPSTTHLLLSASLADDDSYVHTAAVPVLVNLAVRAANPVLNILVDAFIDVEERSLKLAKGKRTEDKDKELLVALDFRLRVGEVLNNVSMDDAFWGASNDIGVKYGCLHQIIEACLSLASRRGQRHQTLEARQNVLLLDAQRQEEAEAAWGGPIPNLLSKEEEYSEAEDKEREALLRVVKGWDETGIEEDVRIRTSAMSVLGTVLEKRLDMLSQVSIDASLQSVLFILAMETSASQSILRRAAVLAIMGVLRAMDSRLEDGRNGGTSVGLGGTHQEEVGRLMRWVRDEDSDELVREHAASVVEGLEMLEMKKLYKIRDEGLRLDANLGLEGPLRGLNVQPQENGGTRARVMVEEIE